MKRLTIGNAFEVNPRVLIKRGTDVPFITMDRLKPGHRDVTATETRAFSSGSKFEAGDTLMARITPCLENGKIARYLPENAAEKATGSTEFIVLRGKPGVTITDFAYYFVTTPAIHDLSVSLMTGTSGRQRVDIGALCAAEVTIPDLGTQRSIVTILGSLDDKIAANQKAVLQLDNLRQALWQRNLQDGAFPKPLSSLASFVNGGAFTKNATGTGRVVVRIAELTGGIGGNTVRNVLDVPDNQVVRNGDLLFSWSGTLMVKRWPLGEAIVNQHIFKVVPDRDFPAVFLDCAIDQQLEYFRMIAAGKATTMGHIKRSDLDAEVEIPVQIREDDLQLSSSLWDTAVSLEKENVSLAKTRDELLPLLMSGKITVKEAEQEASAAGADIASEENKA